MSPGRKFVAKVGLAKAKLTSNQVRSLKSKADSLVYAINKLSKSSNDSLMSERARLTKVKSIASMRAELAQIQKSLRE